MSLLYQIDKIEKKKRERRKKRKMEDINFCTLQGCFCVVSIAKHDLVFPDSKLKGCKNGKLV